MSISAPRAVRTVANVIAGAERDAVGGGSFEKRSPATGEVISSVARSDRRDVDLAVAAAREAQPDWARTTVAERGAVLRRVTQALESEQETVAEIVAAETGKAPKEALGEAGAAIEMGYFVAGEGRRFYGRTTTSAIPNRQAMTVRQPLGVAGLIIAANTPIANVAWKVFPALLCGNGAVLKAS
jgi:alpha-ketoglutaric semialdehyde dehydrogenase